MINYTELIAFLLLRVLHDPPMSGTIHAWSKNKTENATLPELFLRMIEINLIMMLTILTTPNEISENPNIRN